MLGYVWVWVGMGVYMDRHMCLCIPVYMGAVLSDIVEVVSTPLCALC